MTDTLTKWLDEEKENAHFIKEYASGKALLKMQEYKKKEEIFNSKYKTSFVEFEKKFCHQKRKTSNYGMIISSGRPFIPPIRFGKKDIMKL